MSCHSMLFRRIIITCTLWCNICTHCVTRRIRLLVLMLSKSHAIIMFGIQLVRYNIIQSELEYEYVILDRMLFSSCPRILSCLASVPFHSISWFFSGKGWHLTYWSIQEAYKKHTRRLTHKQHMKCVLLTIVQHTKCGSCVARKI